MKNTASTIAMLAATRSTACCVESPTAAGPLELGWVLPGGRIGRAAWSDVAGSILTTSDCGNCASVGAALKLLASSKLAVMNRAWR